MSHRAERNQEARVLAARIFASGAAIWLASQAIGGAPALAQSAVQEAPPVFTVLHKFSGADGQTPFAGLAIDTSGALYGTTVAGGAFGGGVAFRLEPPADGAAQWTQTVLHSFGAGFAETMPMAPMVFGPRGVLYGETTAGGATGAGTIFRLAPPPVGGVTWHETVLYNFQGVDDGAFPLGGLTLGPNGALFGVTELGGKGVNNHGTAFEVSRDATSPTTWSEVPLTEFPGPHHVRPYGKLALDHNGALYGGTLQGGANNFGMIFKLTPPTPPATKWTFADLHDFAGGDGVGAQFGLTLANDGSLYGTTVQGGTANFGVAFKLSPPVAGATQWTETVLHNFAGGADGYWPSTGIVLGPRGVLYGASEYGGGTGCGGLGCGTLYKLSPPTPPLTQWSVSILHSFAPSDGVRPAVALTLAPDGALFGVAAGGGDTSCGKGGGGCGTIFEYH